MTATEQVSERQARDVAEQAREAQWRQPSFGKELFLGRLRLDLVHPHPSGSAEAQERGEAFLAKLRDFCESKIDAAVIERDAQIPDEVIQGLKELGAFGMKIGKEYDGLGLSQVYYNKALMMIGSVHPSLGALLSAHQSIGVPQPIKMFGTDEQKRTWLPRCTREISAFLLTEPDVGSDPARLHATAMPDGNDYVLNGVKLWTTNGVIADLLVVMAQVPKSEGHRGGITAFVVEADAEGIVVQNRNAFMGLRGIENGLTRLNNVRIPGANRIGKEGEGLKVALSTLNVGRLSLPAVCAGSAKWCLKIAREWSRERVQWGRPVGEHGAVSGKIAFIAATAYGLEAMLELSSELADAGAHDIRIEAALAKLYGSEMGWLIADELVQIRGGRGFETAASLAARGERGVPAEQVLRDMRINRIFEGSTEIMHLLIAREAVDAHLSVAGDIIDPDADLKQKAKAATEAGKFYARWLPTLVSRKRPAAHIFRRIRANGKPFALCRTGQPPTGAQHLLRNVAMAGQARAQAAIPGPDRRYRRRAVRDDRGMRPGAARQGGRHRRRARRRVLPAGPGSGRAAVRRPLAEQRRLRPDAGSQGARGSLHVAGGGHHRSVDRGAMDRAGRRRRERKRAPRNPLKSRLIHA